MSGEISGMFGEFLKRWYRFKDTGLRMRTVVAWMLAVVVGRQIQSRE